MVIEIPQIENEEAKKQIGKNNSIHNEVNSLPENKRPEVKPEAVDRPRYNYSATGYEYQKEELFLKYQSKDGDYLELSYSSESLQAFQLEGSTSNEKEAKGFDEIVHKIEEFISNQNQKILDVLFGILNEDKNDNSIKILGDTASGELNIPEYWNAENTSQRIVDFATSFYDVAGMDGEAYGNMMIDAVKKGFEEANAILGNLPGAVGELVDETQKLTLEKLDAWVAENAPVAVAA